MNEDFLQYVWKFQKFNKQKLQTTTGETISILKTGVHNHLSGPDFFNAHLIIGNQEWVGTVEVHIQSSYWYLHKHEKDPNYDTVILHVVWEHDTEVYRKDQTSIPVLELKQRVFNTTIQQYQKLFNSKKRWINCENELTKVDSFIISNWLERLYLDRLQQKSIYIEETLSKIKGHWEYLLFILLSKNFGLKVNAESFLSIAQSIPASVFQKNRQINQLEALFYGQAGFFNKSCDDNYFLKLKKEYAYLVSKFNLSNKGVINPQFFRLRPPNFPTIRLSQLAKLYASRISLFSDVMAIKNREDAYKLFQVKASEYWDSHFNFGLVSYKRKKGLSKSFIDLLIINTIIPLQFAYSKYQGKDKSEYLLDLARSIPSEKNTIIKKFKERGIKSISSLDSQSLLQLKNNYCDKHKCLHCSIGNEVLKLNY